MVGVWVLFALLMPPAMPALGGEPEALDDAARERSLRRQVDGALASRDFAAAAKLLGELAPLVPRDAFVRYNLACARAMSGDKAGAEQALEDAVAHGFVDFFHMQRDAQLEAIRAGKTYQTLIRGWRELLDARGDADLAAMKQRFTPGAPPQAYVFETDTVLRLHYAAAFRAESFKDAKAQVQRVTAWARRELFPEEKTAEQPDPRPDPWVAVVLPTPLDFFKLVFSDGVGGYYDKDRRRLVTQDIGPTLRHEFLHVLHWRFCERRGQRHPLWVMEGLASLLEDVDMPGEPASGVFEIRPSWRTNIVRRLAKMGGLTPLERFVSLPDKKFMEERPRAGYAQARAVMMFLRESGKLQDWFAAYVRMYDEDASGKKALEEVFDLPLGKLDAKFRAWAVKLPEAAEVSKPAKFGLGVSVSGGRGEGVVIDRVVTGSRLARGVPNPLRLRDVIVRIGEKPVRNLDDYVRVLGELQEGLDPPAPAKPTPPAGVEDPLAEPPVRTGPKVKVTVHRGTLNLVLEVTLVEIPEEMGGF